MKKKTTIVEIIEIIITLILIINLLLCYLQVINIKDNQNLNSDKVGIIPSDNIYTTEKPLYFNIAIITIIQCVGILISTVILIMKKHKLNKIGIIIVLICLVVTFFIPFKKKHKTGGIDGRNIIQYNNIYQFILKEENIKNKGVKE